MKMPENEHLRMSSCSLYTEKKINELRKVMKIHRERQIEDTSACFEREM